MPARQGRRQQETEHIVEAILDRVLDALASPAARNITSLRALPDIPTMAAKEFGLKEAVHAFGLKFTEVQVPGQAGQAEPLKWDIPETKDFSTLSVPR